nr:MAG TPA: hypothetical protein [Caudoviricetes sp.]
MVDVHFQYVVGTPTEVGVCIPYRNNFKVFRQDEAHITYDILKL